MKTSNSKSDSPKRLRKFGNDNGTLVLFALKAYQEPATSDEILSLIADGKKNVKDAIRDSIHETLESGVMYGYLAKKDKRYFLPFSLKDNERNVNSISKVPMKKTRCKKTKRIIKNCSICCLEDKHSSITHED